MATLTKMAMIKALVEANQVDEMKEEKDDSVKLAARLFKALSSDKVKELYATRIAKEAPEKAIEEVTKKVEKAAKSGKKAAAKKEAPKKDAPKKEVAEKPAEKKDPMYEPITDAAGNTYKKTWVYEELNARGFSELTYRDMDLRKLKGKKHLLIYSRVDNAMVAKDLKTGRVVRKTICICPYIVKAFIDKFLK